MSLIGNGSHRGLLKLITWPDFLKKEKYSAKWRMDLEERLKKVIPIKRLLQESRSEIMRT